MQSPSTSLFPFFSKPKKSHLWVTAYLLVIAISLFYWRSQAVHPRLVLDGWGPQSYITHQTQNENFASDWPYGIRAYDLSLPMRTYEVLAKIGIPTNFLLQISVLMQVLLFIASAYLLAWALFRHRVTALAVVTVFAFSHLPNLNLANFGTGLSFFIGPYYYSFFSFTSVARHRLFLYCESLAGRRFFYHSRFSATRHLDFTD